MLLIFTTFLLVLAGVSLAILLKRLSDNKLLDENRPVSLAESYRPLFAPTDEDLRLAEAEERKQLTTKQEEAKRQESEEKLAELESFRQTWSESPNRAATIELLYRASQLEDGEAYLNTCDGVLAAWRDGKLADISAGDLAQLLETHFWLLPAGKRIPGASFRLKEAVAELKGRNHLA
jgi:hypothetical protein